MSKIPKKGHLPPPEFPATSCDFCSPHPRIRRGTHLLKGSCYVHLEQTQVNCQTSQTNDLEMDSMEGMDGVNGYSR